MTSFQVALHLAEHSCKNAGPKSIVYSLHISTVRDVLPLCLSLSLSFPARFCPFIKNHSCAPRPAGIKRKAGRQAGADLGEKENTTKLADSEVDCLSTVSSFCCFNPATQPYPARKAVRHRTEMRRVNHAIEFIRAARLSATLNLLSPCANLQFSFGRCGGRG